MASACRARLRRSGSCSLRSIAETWLSTVRVRDEQGVGDLRVRQVPGDQGEDLGLPCRHLGALSRTHPSSRRSLSASPLRSR